MTKPSDYRDPVEYKEVLKDMFLAYVASDEFGTLTKEQRVHAVDCVRELDMMMVKEDNKT